MYQSFFVLVKCAPGSTYRVGEKVSKFGLVTETHSISGEWDLLLRIEIDIRIDFGEKIEQMINEIGEIRITKTFIAYHIFDPDDIFF